MEKGSAVGVPVEKGKEIFKIAAQADISDVGPSQTVAIAGERNFEKD